MVLIPVVLIVMEEPPLAVLIIVVVAVAALIVVVVIVAALLVVIVATVVVALIAALVIVVVVVLVPLLVVIIVIVLIAARLIVPGGGVLILEIIGVQRFHRRIGILRDRRLFHIGGADRFRGRDIAVIVIIFRRAERDRADRFLRHDQTVGPDIGGDGFGFFLHFGRGRGYIGRSGLRLDRFGRFGSGRGRSGGSFNYFGRFVRSFLAGRTASAFGFLRFSRSVFRGRSRRRGFRCRGFG